MHSTIPNASSNSTNLYNTLNEYFNNEVCINRDEAYTVKQKVHQVIHFLVDRVHERNPIFSGARDILYVGSCYQQAQVRGRDTCGFCKPNGLTKSKREVSIGDVYGSEIPSASVKQWFDEAIVHAIAAWKEQNQQPEVDVRFSSFQNGVATRLKICCAEWTEPVVKVDLVIALRASNFDGAVLRMAEASIVKGAWVPEWLRRKMQGHLVITPVGWSSAAWKISSACAEKELVHYLDWTGFTCKKKVYRILKALSKHYWGDREMKSGLTSYILLNIICWEIHHYPDYSYWRNEDLEDRFKNLIARICNALLSRSLISYFTHLPINLMEIQEEKTGFHEDLPEKIFVNQLYQMDIADSWEKFLTLHVESSPLSVSMSRSPVQRKNKVTKMVLRLPFVEPAKTFWHDKHLSLFLSVISVVICFALLVKLMLVVEESGAVCMFAAFCVLLVISALTGRYYTCRFVKRFK